MNFAVDGWFLTGPTAAGKTAVGVELARQIGAEIISMDSMALYRGMDVILLQCLNCGTERTERLAGDGSAAADRDGAGRQSR